MLDIKLFDTWNIVKKRLQQRVNPKYFREGQVWWCSTGQNIGSETYGKGIFFLRPVLILRRFSSNLLLGVPLTSKTKAGDWYSPLSFRGKSRTAMLYQIRVMDSKRLSGRIGEVTDKQLERIKEDLKTLISGKNIHPALRRGSKGNP